MRLSNTSNLNETFNMLLSARDHKIFLRTHIVFLCKVLITLGKLSLQHSNVNLFCMSNICDTSQIGYPQMQTSQPEVIQCLPLQTGWGYDILYNTIIINIQLHALFPTVRIRNVWKDIVMPYCTTSAWRKTETLEHRATPTWINMNMVRGSDRQPAVQWCSLCGLIYF